jgi:hypothetical protein
MRGASRQCGVCVKPGFPMHSARASGILAVIALPRERYTRPDSISSAVHYRAVPQAIGRRGSMSRSIRAVNEAISIASEFRGTGPSARWTDFLTATYATRECVLHASGRIAHLHIHRM